MKEDNRATTKAALNLRCITNFSYTRLLRLQPVGYRCTDFLEVTDSTWMQRHGGGVKREIDRQVFCCLVHSNQIVLFLEQKLGQVVGQVVGHIGIDDQNVGDTKCLGVFGYAVVGTACQCV